MKTYRKATSRPNRQADDKEAPIQKSSRAIWVALFILLILAGLAYLLFSTLPLEEAENRQRLLVSALSLMLLIMGLLVFIRGWFKKTTRKKTKIKRKSSGNNSGRKSHITKKNKARVKGIQKTNK
ncbi:MAG: hypothetical protein M0P23_02370 [Bacteroidales bacterium]|jgi:uncharacterized protein YjeT (DUF2065 family)|nr:hypothetical protein [Bacteroidales bacterium]